MTNKNTALYLDCKDAIERSIAIHYHDNRLDTTHAVADVLANFDVQRVQDILANTVLHKLWDGRISADNKLWAKNVLSPEDTDVTACSHYLVVENPHTGLFDLFLTEFRKKAGGGETP